MVERLSAPALLPSAQSRWTPAEACAQAGVLQYRHSECILAFSHEWNIHGKTAFCPGPGYGVWEFTVTPYRLTRATQTCQCRLDKVLKQCKESVCNYLNNCNMDSHISNLQRVLSSLLAAIFTLRGSKCFFGRNTITHLGFWYSRDRVTPVTDWPTPTNKKEVRTFLGPANFCRCFILKFADIKQPLTYLRNWGNLRVAGWAATCLWVPQTGPNDTPSSQLPETNRQFCPDDGCLRYRYWCSPHHRARHCGQVCKSGTHGNREIVCNHWEGLSCHCPGGS